MRVGIEVGGTFTDLLSLDDAGRVQVCKVPSVPSHPDQGAYAALEAAGILPAGCTRVDRRARSVLDAVRRRSTELNDKFGKLSPAPPEPPKGFSQTVFKSSYGSVK